MEAICSSETSVATQQTTRRHIPEDDTLNIPLLALKEKVLLQFPSFASHYLYVFNVTFEDNVVAVLN
jgi:hypothetical protein